MMATAKPFVKIACLCERVLVENDGVHTIIRVVDQFTIKPIPKKVFEVGATPQFELTLVLGLTNNGLVGKHKLSVQLFGPTKAEPPSVLEMEFPQGTISGFNAIVNVAIGIVNNYGDCRFEIGFDDEPLTVVPFRLIEAKESPSPKPAENSHS
jgi:hypothetical protein